MIVANPIYDTIFKRLMENERLAGFFISTLISEEIVELRVRPQEYTHVDQNEHILKELNEKFTTQEVQEMAQELQRFGSSGEIRRQLENEHEYIRTMNALFGESRRKMEKMMKEMDEKRREMEERDREIGEKDREIGEKEKEIQEKNKEIKKRNREMLEKTKALDAKNRTLGRTISLLLETGMKLMDIASQLGLTETEAEAFRKLK